MRAAAAAAILLAGILSCSARAGDGEEAPDPPRRQEWLVRHQDADGAWDPVQFDRHCEEPGRCEGEGLPGDRVGTTGLALLVFLGYGETHETPRYGDVVRRALLWYRERQRDSGAFEPVKGDRFLLDHARATLALATLYRDTRSPFVRGTAQRAATFLVGRRLEKGGWPAGASGKEVDLETTAWAVAAVRAAAGGGLEVGEDPLAGVKAWLDAGTDPETGRFGPGPGETATAMALYTRLLLGTGGEPDPAVAKGADLLRLHPLEGGDRGERLDFRYAYFGSEALCRVGGPAWTRWTEACKRAVVDNQRLIREECRYGSFDPTDASAVEGRVGATALAVLSLEVYYRYAR